MAVANNKGKNSERLKELVTMKVIVLLKQGGSSWFFCVGL